MKDRLRWWPLLPGKLPRRDQAHRFYQKGALDHVERGGKAEGSLCLFEPGFFIVH